MKWLVTVRRSANLEEVHNTIRECGGDVDSMDQGVPIENSELVVYAEGPPEFCGKLKRDPNIVEVYPDSEMELY